jgi:hypothetical protein
MRPYMQRLLGTDNLEAKTLELLTAAWAKSTSDTNTNAIKPYFHFCEEQGLPPLAATAATMARYIAWIGERGTIKATSMQPYLLALNGFFKDHGAKPVAQGDLVAKVRRGLAASQVPLHRSRRRLYLPARILVSSYASPRTYARSCHTLGLKPSRTSIYYLERVWQRCSCPQFLSRGKRS